jgi:RNA-binding protein YlmH
MEKKDLVARYAQTAEDRLLLARVLDKFEQTDRRSVPTSTGFLTPREQQLAQAMLRSAGAGDRFRFDGGYQDAERKIVLFLPEWMEEPEESLAFLRATLHGADSALTHRDVLGSLMALGVTRERVGDILVGEGSVDVVVSPALSDFLVGEWQSAGRVKLTVGQIRREDLSVPAAKIKKVRDTVSSLRLDAVVSTAFSLSRGRAGELIAAGKVNVDHVPCLKPDKLLAEGTVLTARGLGKARLTQVGGLSKKGRIGITVERYI